MIVRLRLIFSWPNESMTLKLINWTRRTLPSYSYLLIYMPSLLLLISGSLFYPILSLVGEMVSSFHPFAFRYKRKNVKSFKFPQMLGSNVLTAWILNFSILGTKTYNNSYHPFYWSDPCLYWEISQAISFEKHCLCPDSFFIGSPRAYD